MTGFGGRLTNYAILKAHDGDPFIKREDDIETKDEAYHQWRLTLMYPIFMVINVDSFIID